MSASNAIYLSYVAYNLLHKAHINVPHRLNWFKLIMADFKFSNLGVADI